MRIARSIDKLGPARAAIGWLFRAVEDGVVDAARAGKVITNGDGSRTGHHRAARAT